MSKFLVLTFIVLGSFVSLPAVQAMESPETEEQSLQKATVKLSEAEKEINQRRADLKVPEGMFIPKDVLLIIYTFTKNKIGFTATCKDFYAWLGAWPLDLALTLPPTFKKEKEVTFYPWLLEFYSDDMLSNIGLQIVQEAKRGNQPFTVSYDYAYVPTVLNVYFIDYPALLYLGLEGEYQPNQERPAIMKFLKTPKGDVKILKVRQLSDSKKAFIESEGITVEILPPLEDDLYSYKDLYLKDSYWDLLCDLFKVDDKKQKNCTATFEERLKLPMVDKTDKEERYDHNVKCLSDVLDTYQNIKNHYPGIIWRKIDLRNLLLYFRKRPEKLSLIESMLTSYLSTPDSFLEHGSLCILAGHIETLNPECLKLLRAFIPAYQNRHFEDCILMRKAPNEVIIKIIGSGYGYNYGVMRWTLFDDLVIAICKCVEKDQPILLKRLLSWLTLEHIEKVVKKTEYCRMLDHQYENALRLIRDILKPLSDERYAKFLLYLKDNKIDINPLETEAKDQTRDALRRFEDFETKESRESYKRRPYPFGF